MPKIRNHKQYEYIFHPYKESKLYRGKAYIFKYKSSLMRFLNANFENALNGEVVVHLSSFNGSGTHKRYFVWYTYHPKTSNPLRISLRLQLFRGRKKIFGRHKISKSSKKYYAFSDKIISLMCNIYQDDDKTILPKDAKRLITLFEKRGFKDFEPTEEDWEYINGHILNGICFSYWSDRCNFLRCKVILEYFKREELV